MYLFQSKRLGFRNWTDEDIKPMAEICADPEVMRFFPSTMDEDQTAKMIEKFITIFKEKGYTFYAVDLLESKELIGFIGFSYAAFEGEFKPMVEIGWRLAKTCWNKGLATEGAQRCLDYARENLDFKTVFSFTAVLNKPSERVMQKIGMTFQKEFDHPRVEDGHKLKPHVLYTLNL